MRDGAGAGHDANAQAALDLLARRKSAKPLTMTGPGPSAAELDRLLTLASRVPDHGKLAPWRFIVFEGDARARAGEIFAQAFAARHSGASAEQLDLERKRFQHAPLVIAVVSHVRPHPKIPEFEQLLSAGNVAFNIVNGAYALGFAAQWVTRWYAYDETAARMLGAEEGERFVGFVHIGTPTATIEDRPRPALEDVVSSWRG